MIQFNSIPSQYDEDIDNTFYQWCNTTGCDYYSEESDYPVEFQQYYIENVYPSTLQGVITY